jgi:RpiB/LacA/LacB family sugar-phosphate isomerase
VKVFLGTDHRGFELKEKIKGWLSAWKYQWEDLGAYEFDPKDDYPLYAQKVGSIVGKGEGLGILLCGSGVGVDVTANKIDGVRASIGKNVEQVKAGRNDDEMNVLVIAADYTKEEEVKNMVKTFLETEFAGKARFIRRLSEIEKIEANN